MGQLCTFADACIVEGSLSVTLELCLRCISRYTGLSSIAKKSFHLLQESAERLLLNNRRRTLESESRRLANDLADVDDHQQHANTEYPANRSQETVVQDHRISEEHTQPPSHRIVNPLEKEHHTQSSKVHSEWGFCPEADLEVGQSDVLDGELWSNDPAGTSYWPFMPFLSQLETLPSNFETSMIG